MHMHMRQGLHSNGSTRDSIHSLTWRLHSVHSKYIVPFPFTGVLAPVAEGLFPSASFASPVGVGILDPLAMFDDPGTCTKPENQLSHARRVLADH